MTTAQAIVTAIGTALDAIAAGQLAELGDALAAAGLAADDLADVIAWSVAEYIAWRQELPAVLAAALVDTPIVPH